MNPPLAPLVKQSLYRAFPSATVQSSGLHESAPSRNFLFPRGGNYCQHLHCGGVGVAGGVEELRSLFLFPISFKCLTRSVHCHNLFYFSIPIFTSYFLSLRSREDEDSCTKIFFFLFFLLSKRILLFDSFLLLFWRGRECGLRCMGGGGGVTFSQPPPGNKTGNQQ